MLTGGDEDTRKHDEIHESVHVCSAPGGKTKITAFCGGRDWLNEGFTEFFTITICDTLGVPKAPAYVPHVAFVRRLVTGCGLARIHKAYMKNQGLDEIIQHLAAKWLRMRATMTTSAAAHGNPYNMTRAIAPDDRAKCIETVKTSLKDKDSITGKHDWIWNHLLT